jgi:hypothetical protein
MITYDKAASSVSKSFRHDYRIYRIKSELIPLSRLKKLFAGAKKVKPFVSYVDTKVQLLNGVF